MIREYRVSHGARLPSSVEVTWDLEEGEFSYARFEVTALGYTLPVRF